MSQQDMTTHMTQEAATGGGQGQGQGRGQGAGIQEQAQASTEALDWRILTLAAGGLSVAFTLITIGISSLKRTRQGPSPT
jgi:hypothetical protein